MITREERAKKQTILEVADVSICRNQYSQVPIEYLLDRSLSSKQGPRVTIAQDRITVKLPSKRYKVKDFWWIPHIAAELIPKGFPTIRGTVHTKSGDSTIQFRDHKNKIIATAEKHNAGISYTIPLH